MIGLSENNLPVGKNNHPAISGNRIRIFALALIRIERSLLLVRPSCGSAWQAPGVEIKAGIVAENTLRQIVMDQTGMEIMVGNLSHELFDPQGHFCYRYFRCVPKVWCPNSLIKLPRLSGYTIQRWPLDALPIGFSPDGIQRNQFNDANDNEPLPACQLSYLLTQSL